MIRKRSELLSEALELPVDERAQLAAEIVESLDGPFDEDAEQAWDAEIDRRLATIADGTAKKIPWSEVRLRLRGQGCDRAPG